MKDLVESLKAEIVAAKEYLKEYEEQILSLQDFIEDIRALHSPDQGTRGWDEDPSKVYCRVCKDCGDERAYWPCRPAQDIISKVKFINIWRPEKED